MSQPPSSFPQTRWTVVQRMSDNRKVVRLEGWDDFVGIYWPTLVAWLERRGVTAPNAQDLVQGFFEKLWRTSDFTERLSPDGGKLRSFLLTALQNWHRDQIERESSQKRGGGRAIFSLDHPSALEEGGHMEAVTESSLYDQNWAHATFQQACRILREEYLSRDNVALFDTGLALLDDPDPERTRELAKTLNLQPNTLHVALKRLKHRLADRLRAEVAATLVDPTPLQIDEELRHLLAAFEASGTFSKIASNLSSVG